MKIYSVHFRYYAHEQVRFATACVAADTKFAATERLLEHVRELSACSHCGGIAVADASAFQHRPARRIDDEAPTACPGSVAGMAEADVRGHASVDMICEDQAPSVSITITIPEGADPTKDNTFTFAQPGNRDNPVVLRENSAVK